MKTNFRPKNSHASNFKKRAIISVSVFVIGALILSFGDTLVVRIFSPLWKGEDAVARSTDSLAGYFRSKASLIADNTVLRATVASDQIKLAELRADQSSAQEIEKILGRVPAGSGVAATVLVHPPETPYDVVVIDAGSKAGIQVGQKARLPEGPEIGSVIEVFPSESKVELYSSSGQKTNAVLERGSQPAALLGRGGGNFEFDLPRDAQVEVGDKILSAALDSALLGVVEKVDVTPTDSFKKVLVRSAADVFSLRFVVVS